jgi:transcriptional regulator
MTPPLGRKLLEGEAAMGAVVADPLLVPGEVVLLAGSRSEQLLFLKKGTVAVVKDGIEIARVTESGAVLGELSVLLNQPHSADVRAVEASQFHVASADILAREPLLLFYIAAILAQRLNAINRVFVELKTQLKISQRGGIVEKTIEKMEGLLGGPNPRKGLESLEPKHGWAIAKRIQQVSQEALQIQQGSLYPALHRLEQQAWIKAEWRPTETGRMAKFYSLTRSGRKQLERELANWARLSTAINMVVQEA